MAGVAEQRLQQLYAAGDDPWNFRRSAYEQAKFRATRAALPRSRYQSALEVGCGNGELARHLSPACASYTGVDAVEIAVEAARRTVPRGRFLRSYLPAELPHGDYDLIVLSEVLYFLDAAGIASLAAQIGRKWHAADIVCVTWLGPSGNALEGREALQLFVEAVGREFSCVSDAGQYRIDVSEGGR
ncbi:class I SAM-dependent methyltransferase [Nitratireductor basaltis]|uniref:Nodulation protein S n=1 Tax=Nitratireductor basaltis TaxID=472175 RepID=A0A084U8J0_9HYPH|nr:SAM-dependent methyltransferase [Nitratireductor basaltis]KFB09276.1 Nodulation protein S [Nitratireductor basaltis]